MTVAATVQGRPALPGAATARRSDGGSLRGRRAAVRRQGSSRRAADVHDAGVAVGAAGDPRPGPMESGHSRLSPTFRPERALLFIWQPTCLRS